MVQWTSSLPPSLTGRLSKHTHAHTYIHTHIHTHTHTHIHPTHTHSHSPHTHIHIACNVLLSTQSRRRHYKTTGPMAISIYMARPMAISIHKICCPPTHHHFLFLCLTSSSKPDTTVCCQATHCTCVSVCPTSILCCYSSVMVVKVKLYILAYHQLLHNVLCSSSVLSIITFEQ